MLKKIFLLLLLCPLSCVIKGQLTRNPLVLSQSTMSHNIFVVECYKDKTYVYIEYAASRFGSPSFSISSKTTLTSPTSNINLKIKKWEMYDNETELGLPRELDKVYIVDAGSYNIYRLEFDALPLGVELITINENINNGFYWNNIHIRNSMKLEDVEKEQASKPKSESSDGTPIATPVSGGQSTSVSQDTQEWSGTGSGFFISKNGYIATNYHVIDGATKMQVEYYQGGKKHVYSASVVISDAANDMAIIKIDDKAFAGVSEIPYRFDNKTKDVGSEVFTLGYPLTFLMGEEIKYTKGEISSKSGFQGDIRRYQISVPITFGNSGGPLFDAEGNLVGITSGGLKKGIADNANYAVKSIYLQTLIDACQERIDLPVGINLSGKTKPEMIKILQEFVVLIKVG